jgi:outer membrane protein TolC
VTPRVLAPRTAAAVLATLLLGGCATFSTDGGFAEVERQTQARIGRTAPALRTEAERAAARDLVASRLQQPLTADAVVEIALANSPDLRARLAELGVVEADLVQAGRLRNPSFSFSRKTNPEVTTIERALIVNIAQALVIPLALDIQRRQFSQAQLTAAAHVIQTAAAARQAFYRAVAAQERVRYFEQVREAADASADLARRMQQAGNFSALQRMREQAFSADAINQLARAQHTALVERENLTRVLGLWGSQANYTLPDRLPDLPAEPATATDAERTAIERRLDVQVAAKNVESLEASFGLSRATPFLSIIESVGYINENKTGEAREDGYEIDISLPIFDWGDARIARSEALHRQAVARAMQVAVNARSEVRENYSSYRTAYDIAKHYRDAIVPLRKRIADENLLRYNGMLIGVFELLADAREQIGSVNAAIEALRDFWLADTALQLAATTASPGSMAAPVPSAMPSAAPAGGH